jgi:hypothetical protein
MLTYGFNKNHQFTTKTDRNFEFFGRGPLNPDRLYMMAQYMTFYEFLKFSNFCSKSMC